MIKKILFSILIVVLLGYLCMPMTSNGSETHRLPALITTHHTAPNPYPSLIAPLDPLHDMQERLHQLAPQLRPVVIDKAWNALQCAQAHHVAYNPILTIIDYGVPSNQKRLWVIDLAHDQLLFHTYVSHGIKSGDLWSQYFSNKFNSKSSSIGVYTTDQAYRGREGLSLKLQGLDRGFNDQAANRSIVMHGGWYLQERFIQRYGRPGRSWGCPAVPSALSQSLIQTIADHTLILIYYPDSDWLSHSMFLNCQAATPTSAHETPHALVPPEERGDILFVDLRHKGSRAESDPVLVLTTDDYERIFHAATPLTRMLRRQMNQREYVVLNQPELAQLAASQQLHTIQFIVPTLVESRGYYLTKMQPVPLGIVQSVNNQTLKMTSGRTLNLASTHEFIRWIGL